MDLKELDNAINQKIYEWGDALDNAVRNTADELGNRLMAFLGGAKVALGGMVRDSKPIILGLNSEKSSPSIEPVSKRHAHELSVLGKERTPEQAIAPGVKRSIDEALGKTHAAEDFVKCVDGQGLKFKCNHHAEPTQGPESPDPTPRGAILRPAHARGIV